jgi:tetratricopeptide (TPR) repeat protein
MSKSSGGGGGPVTAAKLAAQLDKGEKDKPKDKGDKPTVTPNWDKVLYTPDRIQAWMRGDMSLKDLHAISGPEMLEMAVIGFNMYEQGKYEEARIIFEGLTSLDKNEPYYVTALGAVHLARENLETAMNCFNRAIVLNPKEIAAFVNRGEVYLRQGKVMEAARDFKTAVDLDPTGKNQLVHRARVLAAAALEAIESAQGAKMKSKNEDRPKKGAPPPSPAAVASKAVKKK